MNRVKFGDVVVRANTKEDKDNTEKKYYLDGQYFEGEELEVEKGSPLKGATIGPMFYFGFKSGQVLFMSRSFAIKKAAVARFDGICSEKTFVLETKNPSILLQEYLIFILQNQHFWDYCEENKSGSVNFFINWSTLEKYEFDLPDIEVQKRISDCLWSAYEVKKSYRKMISSIDEMVKSQFIEMFDRCSESFKKYPISDLCHSSNDIKCGPFGTQLKQAEYTDLGIPVWGIPQINSGFTLAPDVFVSEEKARQLEQFSLVSEDIAMSRKGNVGQCALYPDSFEDGIIASDVVRIRVNKEMILPHFLVYQLHNSHQIRKQILEVSDGTVMAGINVTKMKGIIVYCPSISSQQKFKTILGQADKSKFMS